MSEHFKMLKRVEPCKKAPLATIVRGAFLLSEGGFKCLEESKMIF